MSKSFWMLFSGLGFILLIALIYFTVFSNEALTSENVHYDAAIERFPVSVHLPVALEDYPDRITTMYVSDKEDQPVILDIYYPTKNMSVVISMDGYGISYHKDSAALVTKVDYKPDTTEWEKRTLNDGFNIYFIEGISNETELTTQHDAFYWSLDQVNYWLYYDSKTYSKEEILELINTIDSSIY